MPTPEPPTAPATVDAILADAAARGASDVHLEPTAGGYDVRVRVDGLLSTARTLDAATGRAAVVRLMVLARLLTYRLDVPQEGRMAMPGFDGVELRLAVIPTANGLRAAVRLPAGIEAARSLDQLGLPAAVVAALEAFCDADAGLLAVVGPAGSGKTTTIYAVLERLAARGDLSVVSLEDPVERCLPGVTQVEVTPFGQMTYDRALRSVLRQDPQVLMLGEVRDAATASLAVQAALSGHRLVCTLHAADPAGAVARLLEMGVEPYQATSSVFAVVAQRLLRRRVGDGYRGRVPVAEVVRMAGPLRRAVLDGGDADALRAAYAGAGHRTLRDEAEALVASGVTDAAEVARVLGR